MLGINGAEAVVLLVIALVVVGPERLPRYAEQLGQWVRSLRSFVSTTKERVATELGEEAADVDWASLDPRRYDPRRIVREALVDEVRSAPRAGGGYPTAQGARAAAGRAGATSFAVEGAGGGPGAVEGEGSPQRAPFDDEAT